MTVEVPFLDLKTDKKKRFYVNIQSLLEENAMSERHTIKGVVHLVLRQHLQLAAIVQQHLWFRHFCK